MISKALNALENGLKLMRSNTNLLMIGMLVFLFPLLFVWITQSFFITAYDNIHTAQKQRVSLLHDSLSNAIQMQANSPDSVANFIDNFSNSNTDITKIRIVQNVDDKFEIVFANDDQLIGTFEKSDELYRSLPLTAAQNSFIVETSNSNARIWQTFRAVSADNTNYIIFSEHNFSQIDSVMSARRQQSYFGLTAIFVFLIALAYWVRKQIDWRTRHDKLVQQLHERDLFSNMIAHEFRSPLTAIKGYASFLEESEKLTKDEHRFASNIRTSAERLVVLVNDFLEVARVQSGKVKIEKKEIDMRTILTTVVDDLTGMAKEKDLTLGQAVSDKPILIETDPDRMTQVLTNIVSNAIKYTDTGTVELECMSKPGEVTVRVKDTGTGISAEDQQKLFAPFTRVGGVDDSAITGSGLGMWITKQLVELLDGTVGVESIKGVGTHIVITFKT